MSPTRPLFVLTLILGACTGSINQGKDLYGADDDSASDTGATGDSGGGDDDSGADDSTTDDSTVIDDSGGTDDSADTEDSEVEGWPGSCGNYWDPVDIKGWSRSYDIVYNGQTGTEFQTGEGEIAASGLYRFTTDMGRADGSG